MKAPDCTTGGKVTRQRMQCCRFAGRVLVRQERLGFDSEGFLQLQAQRGGDLNDGGRYSWRITGALYISIRDGLQQGS